MRAYNSGRKRPSSPASPVVANELVMPPRTPPAVPRMLQAVHVYEVRMQMQSPSHPPTRTLPHSCVQFSVAPVGVPSAEWRACYEEMVDIDLWRFQPPQREAIQRHFMQAMLIPGLPLLEPQHALHERGTPHGFRLVPPSVFPAKIALHPRDIDALQAVVRVLCQPPVRLRVPRRLYQGAPRPELWLVACRVSHSHRTVQ